MPLNITEYTPTDWVNDSEPDIDENNLNKIEQGIKTAVDGVNAIVDALTSQIENNPEKFASIAALYSVNQSLNTLSNTVATLNSNFTVVSISPTIATQSYYTISELSCIRKSGWVIIKFSVAVTTAYGSFPGITCLSNLPNAALGFSAVFAPWDATSSDSNLRVYVNADGTMALRDGIAGRTYIVYITFPTA